MQVEERDWHEDVVGGVDWVGGRGSRLRIGCWFKQQKIVLNILNTDDVGTI